MDVKDLSLWPCLLLALEGRARAETWDTGTAALTPRGKEQGDVGSTEIVFRLTHPRLALTTVPMITLHF